MGIVVFVLVTGLVGAAVSSPGSGGTTIASQNASGLFAWVAKGLAKLIDPSVPAVANHAPANQVAGAAAASTTTATTVAAPAA